jgi:hypothetical protein
MGEREVEFEAQACGNCHALLVGDYCHHCGQQNKSYVRSVFALIREFLHDFGNWDSRLVRTLVPLMFRPGFLSNEYVADRRARYVPPVRLYLFISIVFFLVLSVVAKVDTEALRAELAGQGVEEPAEGAAPPERRPFSERTNMTVDIPGLSPELTEELRRRIDRAAENPELAFRQVWTLAPQMMFLLLPIFALILKVLYIYKRRYYVEHLVLALHTHSFIFMTFLILIGLSRLQEPLRTLPSAPLTTGVIGWTIGIAIAWIPVYLWLAQKRFYGQGWFLTTVKYVLTGIIYQSMLVTGLIVLILLSIVTA